MYEHIAHSHPNTNMRTTIHPHPHPPQHPDSSPAVVLFNLPSGLTLTINQVRKTLSRDHAVLIISNIPQDTYSLLATHAPNPSSSAPSHGSALVLYPCSSDDVIARKYNSNTEELDGVNEEAAGREAIKMLSGREGNSSTIIMGNHRLSALATKDGAAVVVSFHDFVESKGGDMYSCVHSSVLRRLKLKSGDKLLPGSYENDCNDETDTDKVQQGMPDKIPLIEDGFVVPYTAIPCVNVSSEHERMMILRHTGTKQYLQKLSPSERTQILFGNNAPNSFLLADVMKRVYSDRFADVIGELELSFSLFLSVHCLASFEHWRDLVCLLSFAVDGNVQFVNSRPRLYCQFIFLLRTQMESIDKEFFLEVHYSENNILIPALATLLNACFNHGSTIKFLKERAGIKNEIFELASRLAQFLYERFEVNVLDFRRNGENSEIQGGNDEGGPTVVPTLEIEASYSRVKMMEESGKSKQAIIEGICCQSIVDMQSKYPLLFSSLSANEDILMFCARIMDEKKDVTLVREAHNFLEDFERIGVNI